MKISVRKFISLFLMGAGIVVLFVYAYMFFGTTVVSKESYDDTNEHIVASWNVEETTSASPEPIVTEVPVSFIDVDSDSYESGIAYTDYSNSVDSNGSASLETRIDHTGENVVKVKGNGTSGTVNDDGSVNRVTGNSFAQIRVPYFDDDWVVPIFDGTNKEILKRGVGWYESSAAPGMIGNFAVAGHSVTYGEPFKKLMQLPIGSEVVVETKDNVFTYRITDTTTVDKSDSWVLARNPEKPGEPAVKSMITLTTCEDFFRSPDRYVAFGVLVDTIEK